MSDVKHFLKDVAGFHSYALVKLSPCEYIVVVPHGEGIVRWRLTVSGEQFTLTQWPGDEMRETYEVVG